MDHQLEANDEDSALMLRVKSGDLEAFECLVERYKHPVANLVYRFIQDATEAEDLAQKVFIQVYKSASRYQAKARFSTWLFTIARNLSLNEIRRRSRHPADSLDAEPESGSDLPSIQYHDPDASSPAETALKEELVEKVNEALNGLPENQRTALTLFQQQGLSYEEIGEIIGCSLSATKSLIFRARETMKLRLKPYLQHGQWEANEKTPKLSL